MQRCCIEHTLKPITGKTLFGDSAIAEDGARLDIAANDFWGGCYERVYFDVSFFLIQWLPPFGNKEYPPRTKARVDQDQSL